MLALLTAFHLMQLGHITIHVLSASLNKTFPSFHYLCFPGSFLHLPTPAGDACPANSMLFDTVGPYSHTQIVLSASLNKAFPSFHYFCFPGSFLHLPTPAGDACLTNSMLFDAVGPYNHTQNVLSVSLNEMIPSIICVFQAVFFTSLHHQEMLALLTACHLMPLGHITIHKMC